MRFQISVVLVFVGLLSGSAIDVGDEIDDVSAEKKLSVGSLIGEAQTFDWVKVNDRANWQARDSSGELVYKDQLWVFGGWFDSFAAPPRDVWSSPDGLAWSRVTAEAPWRYSDLPMTIAFIPSSEGCTLLVKIMQPSGVHGDSAAKPPASRPALFGCSPSTSFAGSIALMTVSV